MSDNYVKSRGSLGLVSNYVKLGRRELRDAIAAGHRVIRPGETWTKVIRHPETGEKVLTVKRANPVRGKSVFGRQEWLEVLHHMRCHGLKGGPELS